VHQTGIGDSINHMYAAYALSDHPVHRLCVDAQYWNILMRLELLLVSDRQVECKPVFCGQTKQRWFSTVCII